MTPAEIIGPSGTLHKVESESSFDAQLPNGEKIIVRGYEDGFATTDQHGTPKKIYRAGSALQLADQLIAVATKKD